MNQEQLTTLADFYYTKLVKDGAIPKKMEESAYATGSNGNQVRDHLAWACTYVKTLIENFEELAIPEAQQWLGFIQGALWRDGVFSAEDMRQHDRGNFQDGDLDG